MNKETLRAIKFTLFSISAGVIQIGTFTLLNELSGLPEHWSYLIALVLSVLWNFTFNRRYTFRRKCAQGHGAGGTVLLRVHPRFHMGRKGAGWTGLE